ncbi:sodium:alanine symporter family protein [Clostridium sp. JS66]|uniref:alanine/glycine:cation symporter family protein n=1 Tax=Clostridium sp. JS66 TaxID=3064705 RepID=UPI00298E2E97|nr:sodium:alanine symporter family protein [Clostridium sp. JS66]WPC41369.1 sodium:alanine symporter family protein [Clostridium sp. JS66]
MEQLLQQISIIVWGPWTVIALVGLGVYLTIGTRFLQVRKFPFILKETFGKIFMKKSEIKGEGTLTPFQSATTALASTVGVGSIVGVATALAFGGPGSIFWMWIAAFFGMCTKYAEITLSIAYREKNEEGEFVGGPTYYMRKGLNSKFLASWFVVTLILNTLSGTMIQSNALAGNIMYYFNVPSKIVGFVIIALVGIVSMGGIGRIGKVTSKLIPSKVILYLTSGIIVILFNITKVPDAFMMIFKCAFSPASVGGGIGGFAVAQAIRYGINKGLYSNEAGQGTAPIAHATAKTDHPARQGMWGIVEVFIVTFVICTITSLAILTTGVLGSGQSPNILTSVAFGKVSPIFSYVVSISVVLCAYSTLIGLCYYGESTLNYIGGAKLGKCYRYVFLVFIFLGSVGALKMVWSIGEIVIGLGALSNIIAIVRLSPQVFKLTREFFDDNDENEEIEYKSAG